VSIFADDTANAIQKLQNIVKEKAARQEAEQKHTGE
jgi:hypothetical protein